SGGSWRGRGTGQGQADEERRKAHERPRSQARTTPPLEGRLQSAAGSGLEEATREQPRPVGALRRGEAEEELEPGHRRRGAMIAVGLPVVGCAVIVRLGVGRGGCAVLLA